MKDSVCWTPYGSLGTTCNTCRRLYAQDLKKRVNCNGCRDAPMDIHDIEKACDVCTEDELDIMNNGGDDQ
jgi:Zn finger protein HypA/HybF involved in hydrogenase expression